MSNSVKISSDRMRDYQFDWPGELRDLRLGEAAAAAILSQVLVRAFDQIAPVWDTWFAGMQSPDFVQVLARAEERCQDYYGFSLSEFARRDSLGMIPPSLAAADLRVVVSSACAPSIPAER